LRADKNAFQDVQKGSQCHLHLPSDWKLRCYPSEMLRDVTNVKEDPEEVIGLFKAGLTNLNHERMHELTRFDDFGVVRAGKLSKLSRHKRWQKRNFELNAAGSLKYTSKASRGLRAGLVDLTQSLSITVEGSYIVLQMPNCTSNYSTGLLKLRAASAVDAISWYTAFVTAQGEDSLGTPVTADKALSSETDQARNTAATFVQRYYRGSRARNTFRLHSAVRAIENLKASAEKNDANGARHGPAPTMLLGRAEELIDKVAKEARRLRAAKGTVQGASGWYKVGKVRPVVSYFWQDPTRGNRWKRETAPMVEYEWQELMEKAESTEQLVPLEPELALLASERGRKLLDRHGRLSLWEPHCAGCAATADSCDAGDSGELYVLRKCLWRKAEVRCTCGRSHAHDHSVVDEAELYLGKHMLLGAGDGDKDRSHSPPHAHSPLSTPPCSPLPTASTTAAKTARACTADELAVDSKLDAEEKWWESVERDAMLTEDNNSSSTRTVDRYGADLNIEDDAEQSDPLSSSNLLGFFATATTKQDQLKELEELEELEEEMQQEQEREREQEREMARYWEQEKQPDDDIDEQDDDSDDDEEEATDRTREEQEERRLAAEEQARLVAVEQAKKEAEEQARLVAEEQARLAAAEQAKKEAEEQVRLVAEEQARLAAEEQARLAAVAQARLAEVAQARLVAEEQARLAAEEQARLAAEEQAKQEAEDQARLAAEARLAVVAQARLVAEEQAKLAAAEQVKKEAEEQVRLAAVAQARLAAEEQAKQEAEEQARLAAVAQARLAAEEQARLAAEEQAREEAVEQARKAARLLQSILAAEEQARLAAEEQAQQKAEQQTKKEAVEQARQEAFNQARQDAKLQARQAIELQSVLAAAEQDRKEAEQRAKIVAEQQALSSKRISPPIQVSLLPPPYIPSRRGSLQSARASPSSPVLLRYSPASPGRRPYSPAAQSPSSMQQTEKDACTLAFSAAVGRFGNQVEAPDA
jgi:hypothetical protein